MTGLTKNGPKRFSYKDELTRLARVWGGDIAFLAQAVHVDLVAEEVRDGVDIGGETSQAEVEGWGVVEDLGEVVGDGQGLHAQAEVAGDGDAVLAHHGDTGTAICVKISTLMDWLSEARYIRTDVEGGTLMMAGDD